MARRHGRFGRRPGAVAIEKSWVQDSQSNFSEHFINVILKCSQCDITVPCEPQSPSKGSALPSCGWELEAGGVEGQREDGGRSCRDIQS